MSGPLDPATANRLAKVCGLLGSDQDGERSAAAWQATRILRTLGMTWADIFTPVPRPEPSRYSAPAGGSHVVRARWALRFPGLLTDWEESFLLQLVHRRKVTAKQTAVLDEIMRKVPPGGAS